MRRKPSKLNSSTRPLRELQRRAEAMTRGDFNTLGQPVGGSRELEGLRRAMDVLGAHVEQAQRGMQAYISALTDAQEAERGRLARELHDDTVQRLIALGQGVERVERALDRDGEAARERLRALRGEITAAVQALRTVIGDLRPPALEELGLLPAVELLLRRGGDEAPAAIVEIDGEERRMGPQSELALFRIVQEAWTNVRRHAGAQHVWLVFRYGHDALELEFRDDGRGFDPQAPEGERRGWGLLGMRERAEQRGGSLEIDSAEGRVTRLTVRMPYPGVGGRDPICDMVVGPEDLSFEHRGAVYRFCSEACRSSFVADPERYVAG